MLVRDGRDGLEVFMLQRSLAAVFVGGAHVFPGGKVDDDDRSDPDLASVCVGLDDAEASQRMGLVGGGLAYWVAAIRECFEEAGVLLARDSGGRHPRFVEPEVVVRFEDHRRAVHRGERRLVEVCAKESLVLAMDDLQYASHWITPEGSPRRFDTRFFVARAPDDQQPLHDGSETVASRWLRPAVALAEHGDGRFEMITPTIHSVRMLAHFDRADDVMGAAYAATSGPSGPDMVRVGTDDDGGWRIRLPSELG
jgi:8-oxo-dGTP pyrophosphatase MutT (NUDIX family)